MNRLRTSIKYSIVINLIILGVGFAFYKSLDYLGDVGVSYSNTKPIILILTLVTITTSVIVFALLFLAFFYIYDKRKLKFSK